jgi:hypothetical protein
MYVPATHKQLNPFLGILRYPSQEESTLKKNSLKHSLHGFFHSRKALAIPVTFLILFVSTLCLISITYYFAVEKVNSRSQTLKIVSAKQDFISLDENIMAVVWQPGSARVFSVSDSGGQLHVEPNNNSLTISISSNLGFNETVYNGITGQVRYELPYSDSPETGLYLKGDSRTIINQTGSPITQLSIEHGAEHPEIQLRYRPSVFNVAAGTEGNLSVNNLRIYVVNLNTSDSMVFYGQLPLRISCESTHITTTTYNVSSGTQTLIVKSVMDGVSGQVSIPISNTPDGAVVNVEIVQCNIKIVRCLM